MRNPLLVLIKKLRLRQLYLRYLSSIWFLPVLVGAFIIGLAILSMHLDQQSVGGKLLKLVPYLVTRNLDSARVLLSTLVGGTFSLMVFSFTMVMVILTTATGNYSPRVLPGLISNRFHQLVLGLYLGTIAFITIIIINIGQASFIFKVPALSVLISSMLVFCCLVAFIFFIHSVSQNVQASHILHKLYCKTKERLLVEIKGSYITTPPDTPQWQIVASSKTGYFQGINGEKLLSFACEQQVQILVISEKGRFLLEGAPLLKVSKPLPASAVEKLQGWVDFHFQERIDVNYLFGFKHIAEVGVKALSPGINDPGTALTAIDYLTHLFTYLPQIGAFKLKKDEHGTARLYYRQASFEKVFYLVFSSLRNCAATNVVVQAKLLDMLRQLEWQAQQHQRAQLQALFQQERKALLENSQKEFNNARDAAFLDGLFRE